MVPSPPGAHGWVGNLDDIDYDVYDLGLWFLARSVDGSRLLLVHTKGVCDEEFHGGYDHPGHSVDRCGRTVRTYATGFACKVFSRDTSQLHPAGPWKAIADLGAYSLFLGLNYPINIAVGGADVAPGYLTRSNCVYTSHHAVGLGIAPSPKICRFSLNGEAPAVGFSTSVEWKYPETPFWFIPGFANALDWIMR